MCRMSENANSFFRFRRGASVAVFACGLFLLASSAAFAADAVPPGFLPGPGKNDMKWSEGDAFCKSKKGYLPTEAQLKAIAKGPGDGSFAEFGLHEGYYWSRDGLANKRNTVSLADGLAVPASVDNRRPVLCGYGAARPKEATGIAPGFASEMALTSLFWEDADRFCKRQGKQLPAIADLKAISRSSGDGSYTKAGWAGGLYWTREGGNGRHSVVSLGEGTEMLFNDTDKQWAVCVK